MKLHFQLCLTTAPALYLLADTASPPSSVSPPQATGHSLHKVLKNFSSFLNCFSIKLTQSYYLTLIIPFSHNVTPFFPRTPVAMDAIKKKMQAMKVEKDNAMDRSDVCEQAAKDAKVKNHADG